LLIRPTKVQEWSEICKNICTMQK